MEQQLKFIAHIASGHDSLFDRMRKSVDRHGGFSVTKKLPNGAYLILSEKRIDKPMEGKEFVHYGEITWTHCVN